jgi:hypothetical protein
MVGAILDILVATWDGISENVLLIQATFLRGERETQVNFWMIPDRSSLEGICRREKSRSTSMD